MMSKCYRTISLFGEEARSGTLLASKGRPTKALVRAATPPHSSNALDAANCNALQEEQMGGKSCRLTSNR